MKTSLKSKLSKLLLGVTLGLGVAVGAAAGDKKVEQVKAEDELYSSIVFNSTNNSKSQSSYGNSWSNTTNGFTWNLANWNNNSNQWNYIKAGHKSTAYTATAITAAKVPVKISKINVDCSWSNAKVKSVKLYMGSSATSFTTTIATLTSGAKDYTISNPAVDQFYKLEVVCESGSNGMFQLNNIKLYEQKASALPLSISGDATVYNGKTITLSALSNGAVVSGVTWSSSNTGLATVSNTGVVTGVNGTTNGANVTITAKKDGYEDATKTITVKADTKTLKSISASGATSTFTLGDSFATTGLVVKGTYSHTNGDPDSVEEIKTGITTSPTAGTKLNTVGPQTVTVNAGGKSTTYSISVNYAAVQSVKLDYEDGTLGKGGEATLPGVTIEPANANQGYSWGNPVATEGILYTYDPSTHELAIDANNTVEGTIQFTATATGDSSKKATVVYTVEAAQIANITGVTASTTGEIVAKQYVGDAFNAQGFSFAPTWSEGEHDVVEITSNDILWNALVAGSNPTGTYSCADGEFTVTITGVTVVNDTLVSIAFAEGCDMTKKSYNVGDSWDFSGLSIVGTMDSGKTAPAIASSNVTFSSNDAVATNTTSITVTASYQGLTTATAKTITGIEVKEVTMTSLTVNYTGGQPVLGTDFTFAGSITANMSNGTHPTVNLSDVTIGSVDKFTLNQQTITVTHKTTGATGTFNVTYKTKAITTTKVWKEVPFGEGNLLITTVYNSTNYYLPTAESTSAGPSAISFTKTNNLPNISTDNANDLLFSVTKNDDGTYSIKSGDKFLYTTSDNNGVRVASTSSGNKWTYNTSDNYLKNNLSTARYLGVYNGSQWRSYNSSTASNYNGSAKNLKFYTIEEKASGTADIIKLNAALKSGKTFNEGATISASDFNCSTLNNLNETSTVTATSVSPTKLVAGENTITVYYNTWSTTVTVNAAEVAHLDHIEVVEGTGTRSFARESTFNSTGLKIKAYYSNADKTMFPDRELASGFTVTPLTSTQMNVANTYDVSVSYTENGVTKNTTYSVTVTPKVSTSVTIAGDGIEGSNGTYTLASGVTNEVELTLGCNGDETVEFVQGDQNVVTFAYGKLSVNSSTKTTEQITVSFKAGSAIATLTVNISAEEGIQLISNDEIVAYVGSSFTYDINIQLNNVESATWTLPQGDFVIESEIEDNTGFVGTIYFTAEVSDTLTFSVLTGKGETLSVDIEVLAVNDDIKSISASLKSGVTYSAGKGQTFSNDDLTVTYVRDSGAKGTLNSNEFTVSGLPKGGFTRVASYELTVTSTENTDATSVLTINVGMPSDLNLNFVTSKQVSQDGDTVWQKVTDITTINVNKKYALIYETDGDDYMFNNADSTSGYISKSISNNECAYDSSDPYLVLNYSSGSLSMKCVGGDLNGKWLSGKDKSGAADNGFATSTTEKFISAEINSDGEFVITTSFSSTASTFRFNGTSGQDRFRFYKTTTTGDAYHYPSLYEMVTKPGESYTDYINVNKNTDTKYDYAKLYNFITLANETYNNICDGGTTAPDTTDWNLSNSAEYNALGTNELELLRTCICGNGQIGLDGVYVNGDKNASSMVVQFLQKYDYVVYKYGDAYNYISNSSGTKRTPTAVPGLVQVGTASAMFKNMLGNLGLDVMFNEENAPTSWVLLVTIAVAGLATGGYFFIRKRKED